MKTIHKYRLDGPTGVTELKLQQGFRVVRSEYLVTEKAVFLWVEESLRPDVPAQTHRFRVALSGEPVPDDLEYLDTALDSFGPEAYHVFQVPEAPAREQPRQSRFRPQQAA